MMSRPEISEPSTVNSGAVSVTIQEMPASSPKRMMSASERPITRAVALVRRQLVGEDRDEDQVVDAEHDLEHDEGAETEPRGGVIDPGEVFHADQPCPPNTVMIASKAALAVRMTAPETSATMTRLPRVASQPTRTAKPSR